MLMRAVKHHTKPPPWRCHLLIQRHGNGESAHPTPGSLCGRGCPRAVCEVFIPFNTLAKKSNYLLLTSIFIYCLMLLITITPETMAWHPPPNQPWPNRLSRSSSTRPSLLVGCCVHHHPLVVVLLNGMVLKYYYSQHGCEWVWVCGPFSKSG